ncbi:hypothetical protein [Thiomonas sp.]
MARAQARLWASWFNAASTLRRRPQKKQFNAYALEILAFTGAYQEIMFLYVSRQVGPECDLLI